MLAFRVLAASLLLSSISGLLSLSQPLCVLEAEKTDVFSSLSLSVCAGLPHPFWKLFRVLFWFFFFGPE